MIEFINGEIKVDFDRCQQCGACLAVCPVAALSSSRRGDGLLKIDVDHDICIKCKKCLRVCPAGKPQPLDNYFDNIRQRRFYLGHNADPEKRKMASSGGVVKTLVVESLRLGLVDGVYTLRKTEDYPMAEGEFYTRDNIPTFDTMPNSVYHSVAQCLELAKVKKCRRLMIVGTACQLRALSEALKGRFDKIIKVCIFCKQQKSLGSTRFLAKVTGTSLPSDLRFHARYRGDGWPGTVEIGSGKLVYERAAQVPFGRRLWTVGGCNVCGDPFGLGAEADVTLMDPWKIRQRNDLGDTLVTVNSDAALRLMEQIPDLVLEKMSFEQVEPALELGDIRRKQALVPYFMGEKCSGRVKWAGRMERLQRRYLRALISIMPARPFILYRILCRIPDLRNLILGK